MPYTIIKKDNAFLLRNQKTGVFVKKRFKSRDAAKNASRNYMRYEKSKKKSK
tara:strand:+ start:137 stop:292 length:156 start_codon:yes stop_codon:yes gene_type:complete